MHPIAFRQARLEMACNVLNVALAGRVQSRTETTGPVLALTQEFDHLLGMGTRRATMTLLVMLVEGVRSPETSIAARLGARIFPPSLMELVFVAFPIILALEARLA